MLALLLILHAPSEALHVRDDPPALNHRLLDFPGAPIYPQIPSFNPAFIHAPAALFGGIGWPAHPTDWTRQMALVSPRHFVYATHYPLGPDWDIAFLGSDGQQHLYPIESQMPVINSLGQTTDLMLCTLGSEVGASTGIQPFPVLNLASESAYTGQQAVVCGSFVRSGTTTIGGFTTLVNDPGFDTTRFAWFDYNHDTGGPRECDYQGGDSGAPAFIMDGGVPALIGTASGRDPQGWGGLPANVSRNYISFIPAYLSQLDSMMDSKGFHLIRSRPQATSLLLQSHGGPTLRRSRPGSLTLSIANTGGAAAHNLVLALQSAHPPDSISSAMICDQPSSGTWRCRRGGLDASLQTQLTLHWNAMPDLANLSLNGTLRFDGGNAAPLSLTLALTGSYASWSAGLADPDPSSDPDHDGLTQLMEYAFGGDPNHTSLTATNGSPLGPRISISGNTIHITHRRRSDAEARGLTHILESAANPGAGPWTVGPPPGSTVTVAPLSPPEEGFEEVTHLVPLSGDRRFFRIRVELDE